jgi:hypothetical protein
MVGVWWLHEIVHPSLVTWKKNYGCKGDEKKSQLHQVLTLCQSNVAIKAISENDVDPISSFLSRSQLNGTYLVAHPT